MFSYKIPVAYVAVSTKRGPQELFDCEFYSKITLISKINGFTHVRMLFPFERKMRTKGLYSCTQFITFWKFQKAYLT